MYLLFNQTYWRCHYIQPTQKHELVLNSVQQFWSGGAQVKCTQPKHPHRVIYKIGVYDTDNVLGFKNMAKIMFKAW